VSGEVYNPADLPQGENPLVHLEYEAWVGSSQSRSPGVEQDPFLETYLIIVKSLLLEKQIIYRCQLFVGWVGVREFFDFDFSAIDHLENTLLECEEGKLVCLLCGSEMKV
jgi:hypothetical protein